MVRCGIAWFSRRTCTCRISMEAKGLSDRKILGVILLFVRALLLVAIVIEIIFTGQLLYQSLPSGASALTKDTSDLVSGGLLALAIMDIYLSVGVYSRGDIKNLVYIIDAAVFFVVRDIVIQLFNGESSISSYSSYISHVGILGAVVLALVTARYVALLSSEKAIAAKREDLS